LRVPECEVVRPLVEASSRGESRLLRSEITVNEGSAMKAAPLHIFGFEGTSLGLLARLVNENRERFTRHFGDVVLEPHLLPVPEGAYIEARSQHRAQPFLNVLSEQAGSFAHALGFVGLDLFVPNLNFIFGSAQFGGNAIVAIPRLRQSFYGRPDNETLFYERIVKEVFHELGHVLGLRHCTNQCVMRFSNSLADTDNKPNTYCVRCLLQLE
jgi:archaemetzincin